ncbi:MAG: LysM peptidoglycan-binding domain-containing protein [Verrucomicrobiales bacterium]
MSTKKRKSISPGKGNSRRPKRAKRQGLLKRLSAETRLHATTTEEEDWVEERGEQRMTLRLAVTAFLIVHALAFGGIYFFNKMSDGKPVPVSPETASQQESDKAARPVRSGSASTLAAHQTAFIAQIPTEEELRDCEHYRVKSGDDLTSIAKKLGVALNELKRLNGLESGNNLSVGQSLYVPKRQPVGGTAEPPAAPETVRRATPPPAQGQNTARTETPRATPPPAQRISAAPAAAAAKSYTVAKGDTAYGLSRKFGVSVAEILAANGIADAKNLRAGQTITIPAK